MKKVVSVILALVLCCLLVPAVADETVPAGTWYIGSASSDDTEIQIVDPEALLLVVNEDNTFTLTAMDMTVSGTWTIEDSALVLTLSQQEGEEQQDPTVLKYEGGDLLYSMGATVVHLSQTPAEPVELSPAVEAESADAFSGGWKPVATIAYGLYGAINETQAASLLIENGKLSLLLSDGSKMVSYGEYEVAFADGVLTAEDASFGSSSITLSLREDGSLFYHTVTDFGEGKLDITYVYVRAEFEVATADENESESEGE